MSWLENLTLFAYGQMPDFAREALWDRGVSDEQIELYRIGYLDVELIDGIPMDFLKQIKNGALLDKVFLLPLTTALGEVRGFQFRHVDRARGGYTDYFVDRREACLFGLGQAMRSIWDSRSVYLVEGAFDLFPIQRATPNVIATLTAYAPASLVKLLKRIVVEKVWVGYDMDEPGLKGRKQFAHNYKSSFKVYTVRYPKVEGNFIKDPSELWEVWGDSLMIPYVQGSMAQKLSADEQKKEYV